MIIRNLFFNRYVRKPDRRIPNEKVENPPLSKRLPVETGTNKLDLAIALRILSFVFPVKF